MLNPELFSQILDGWYAMSLTLRNVLGLPFVQELSSCIYGRPFGHNKHGPKSGGLLCPFPWGAAVSSNTLSFTTFRTRPTSVQSGMLVGWLVG